MEQTLSIIKPDGVRRNLCGKILGKFEESGLKVVALRMMCLSTREAEGFYAVHKARPFFRELVDMMTSGPVVVAVLQGENAIKRNRDIMGATNPKDAAPGTIRKEYALSLGENTVHGSDGPDTAKQEVAYFFPRSGIFE
jgi:nucleoside-diphosphate kinase